MTDELTERTLRHLSSCAFLDEYRRSEDIDTLNGPKDSSWDELVAAVLDGLNRRWVAYARFYREDGELRLTWRATPLGEREIEAYFQRTHNAKEST